MRWAPVVSGWGPVLYLGLKDFAVLRGGKVIENPRFFGKLERKLKRAQRVLSRKAKGSANRLKAHLA
ncbi:hypothetical protein L0U85_14205, partial [Glycomyces sp. L485]|nr:hypothetical protein [Glycomyces sp. L485]